MQNILKFSYFLLVTLVCSCGDKSSSKDVKETRDNEQAADTLMKSEANGTILFFGNSLTAGYGLDPKQAFPSLIQDRLDSLAKPYTIINAGLSGETTSGGRNRLDWVLNQKTDIFILELGANDGLRGIALAETRANLLAIIHAVREKNPDTQIILAGMQIPPNMGQSYTREFRTIFPDIAEKNDVQLIPFLLEGVAGIPELNQEDGIHPTAKGHKIVANNVWAVLEPLLTR